ncbi:CPBP family intramembrane glutamic endopeptidase [Natronobeatus ordinarius]|uniref:CPBP family intramembrane glutamic endopeptidase n=1 Tax=Natronobeatus ordinarius TaxID=2963433 RepID=UPI0020CD16F6|nr:CPBP family intramembrane glutamic endopeptidase [Natronobeatus ordinarius]
MVETPTREAANRGTVRRLLYGSDDRLRATWRVLVPLVLAIVAVIAGRLLLAPLFGTLVDLDASETVPIVWILAAGLYLVLVVGAATAIALAVASRLDRRSVSSYGFERSRRWVRDFFGGILIGAVAVIAAFGYLAARGRVTFAVEMTGVGVDGWPLAAATILVLLTFVLANNVLEEVVFRGILIGNAAEGLRARSVAPLPAVGAAVAISLPVFGAFHLLSGGLGMVVTSAIGGILFAAGYVLTGQLALPIGVHFGGVIYVSLTQEPLLEGLTLPTVLVVETGSDPSLLLGVELWLVRALIGVVLVAAWVAVFYGGLSIDERVYAADANV